MLQINQLIGFGSGGIELPSVTYLENQTNGSNLTTYTYNTRPTGDDTKARTLVICFMQSASGIGVSSVTVGGVSATLANSASGGNPGAYIAYIDLAAGSGSTATIVFTFTGNATRMAYDSFALYNLLSTTPGDTDNSQNGTDASRNLTMTTQVDGISIVCGAESATTAITSTNFTEAAETSVSGIDRFVSGYDNAITGTSVTYTTNAVSSIACATWR